MEKGLDGEVWKQWKEDIYVSNFGRVIKETSKNGKGFKPRILNINRKNKKKYLNISFGKKNKKAIHLILADCFIPNPNNLPEVDHIDKNRHNNMIGNLRRVNKTEQNINRNIFKNNTSGYKNISIIKNGKNIYYYVRIMRYKKEVFKKLFKTLEEAIQSRDTFLN